MESIHGYIERITFQSEENGFTVARLKEPGKRELTVVVGAMPSVQPGETIRCWGEWKNNAQHGLQFDVQRYAVEMPSDAQGIQKYLGSGLVKGIGPVFAERIVDRFREETLDIIERSPERLREVSGIGAGRLQKIKACWAEQKAIRGVMLFLQQYHVTPTFAQKIYRQYRDESIARIEANPYDLARDVYGIGFKTADSLAQKMGVPRDSPRRIDAGIEYVLAELSGEGHTCFPVEDFLKAAAELLETEAGLVQARVEAVEQEGHIVLRDLQDTQTGRPAPFVWLRTFEACEQGIAHELERLLFVDSPTDWPAAEERIAQAEKAHDIQLAPQQREAVRRSLLDKVQVVTGGPGTGKSTITKVILALWGEKTRRILLAAPTGRAAKRLAEITGREALTLHSLLEFDFRINGFRRDRDNPLEVDLLVVDESSMIDTALFFNLLRALPTAARLLLVGDVDQLPSVGPGKVLADIIASGLVPVTRLTEIFRQAAASLIVTNAHRVNVGDMPEIAVRPEADFFFLPTEDPAEVGALIADLVAERLPKRYGFDSVDDIQVLCPMKIGVLGANNLNEQLQKRLNPETDALQRAGQCFKRGDKVMQLRNNYDKGVYNGDVGRVQAIDRIEQEMTVSFDRRAVAYDFSELDELTLAYAASVHKYQGSECPCVVMPVHPSHQRMLSRNLLYTGITRGKRLVVLVGTQKALWRAVQNTEAVHRHTGLCQALLRRRGATAVLGPPVIVPLLF